MNQKILLTVSLAISTSVLCACDTTFTAEDSKQNFVTSASSQPQLEENVPVDDSDLQLKVSQNCNLSAYVNLPAEQVDFKHSQNSVVVIYKRVLKALDESSFASTEDHNAYLNDVIHRGFIETDLKIACTTSMDNLKDRLLKDGILDLGYLLKQGCLSEFLNNTSNEITSALEQQFYDEVILKNSEGHARSDQEVDEITATHKVLLSDTDIDYAGYMSLDLDLSTDGQSIRIDLPEHFINYEIITGFHTVLRYTGNDHKRCEYSQ